MRAGKASEDGPSAWALATYMECLHIVMGSRLWPGKAPVAAPIWKVDKWVDVCVCVYSILCSYAFQMNTEY